jgi:hypothetical protein
VIVVVDGHEVRLGLLAFLDDHRTAIGEPASGRQREEIGNEEGGGETGGSGDYFKPRFLSAKVTWNELPCLASPVLW